MNAQRVTSIQGDFLYRTFFNDNLKFIDHHLKFRSFLRLLAIYIKRPFNIK